MNTIHEVPIGDLNGNEDTTIASVVSTTSLSNASSISSTSNSTKVTINSSSDTSVPQTAKSQNDSTTTTTTTATTNGEPKSAANKNNQNEADIPVASTSQKDATTTTTTTAIVNGNTKSLLSDHSEDLKIIGHLKNIEKINEKRRLFLNNTISEYTIDEKTETETKTQTINGAETVLSETRIHTREEQQNVGGNKLGSNSATELNGHTKATAANFSATKYATLPRSPGSPPPKPPMLSRARSIGIGDQRSYSATSVPTTPTKAAAAATLAPIATPTPTTISTPTSPLTAAAAWSPHNSPTTKATTLITSTVLPEPIKVATVQLREEPVPTLRRVVERPVSLSPEAPKQISINHYERLIEELKCPGCAYPMKSPILLCKTGHSICQQCTRVLLLCPLCKVSG